MPRGQGGGWCCCCRGDFFRVLRSQAKISKRELSDAQLECVFHAVDVNRSGAVDLEEFRNWINRELDAAGDPEKLTALQVQSRVHARCCATPVLSGARYGAIMVP